MPKIVKGTIRAIILKSMEVTYTGFAALLFINGVFAVLIMCNPIKFDTTPYENQMVWNNAASGNLKLNPNHKLANIHYQHYQRVMIVGLNHKVNFVLKVV